jgi:hemerythrin superfamily protein
MNAIEFLNQDHVLIEALFRRYPPSGKASRKAALFRTIRKELDAHCTIEEDIFYPAVRQARTPRAERLVRGALEKHRVIRQLLQELADGIPGSAAFDAKFEVLQECVMDHAQVEETDLFSEVYGSMSDDDLERLGLKLADRKRELQRTVRRRAISRSTRWASGSPGVGSRSTRSPRRTRKARARAKRR